MPTTLFHSVVVSFAGATPSDTSTTAHQDYVYRIIESPQHHWMLFENERSVILTGEQHAVLVQMLAALQPLPDPKEEIAIPGCDGTWISFIIQRGDQQMVYRWWVYPPSKWMLLGTITDYVHQLANTERQQVHKRQQDITRQFFDCLAARDLPGMLAYYHPDIHYRNPLFDLHGAEVAVMWQMWWNYFPDIRMVCKDNDIRTNGTYWEATYTFPPTGRRIVHRLSTDLTFAKDTIIEHVDRFTMPEWAGQAYGFLGEVIGGWQLFTWRLAVRARARLARERRMYQRED